MFPAMLFAQKTDTIYPLALDEPIVFTVGDVYKIEWEEANPFDPIKYRYIKIDDIRNGWIKYTFNRTLPEALGSYALVSDKSFETEFIESFLPKGKTKPINIYKVIWA